MSKSITLLTMRLDGKQQIRLRTFDLLVNAGSSRNTHATATFTSVDIGRNFLDFLDSGGKKTANIVTSVNEDMPKSIEEAGGEQPYLNKKLHLYPVSVVGSKIENAYEYEKVQVFVDKMDREMERYNDQVQAVLDERQRFLDTEKEALENLEEINDQIENAVKKAGGESVINAINFVFGKKSGKYYQEVVLSYMQRKQCSVDEAVKATTEDVKKFYDNAEKESRKLNLYKANSNPADIFQEIGADQVELFWGYIERIEVKKAEDKSTYVLTGVIKSGSILLDQKKRSRSFQNPKMTYKEVFAQVCQNIETDLQKKVEPEFRNAMYKEAGLKVTIGYAEAEGEYKDPERLDDAIERPLIQQEETDWEFIRRIASRLRLGIIADATAWTPSFSVGIQASQVSVEKLMIIPNFYAAGFNKDYYEMGGRAAGYSKKNFFHVTLLSLEPYPIGYKVPEVPTTVSRRTKTTGFWICGKTAAYHAEENEMHFKYLMAMPAYVTQKKIPFGLAGKLSTKEKTLEGKVLERVGQTIKILFDADNEDRAVRTEPVIDKDAYRAQAYLYKWAPETGNVMYSMPTVDTKVALYFPDDDEQNAFAIHCVRQQERESCGGLQTYTDRWFTSEFQQQMFLKPDSMGFISTGSPLHIIQHDVNGIEIASDGDIHMAASGAIAISAPVVALKGKSMQVGS